MKNYKLALYEAIKKATLSREDLSDYSQDFLADYSADCSAYICDAFSEYADGSTSIYYSDIKNYISEHIDEITEVIDEFGWDGCGKDLYKAGQMAEFREIENTLYSDIEEIVKHLALDYIDSTDEASEEAEKMWEKLDEAQKGDLIESFLEVLGFIDNNSRLDEIVDAYNSFVERIIDYEA